jgi:hypothetical protein
VARSVDPARTRPVAAQRDGSLHIHRGREWVAGVHDGSWHPVTREHKGVTAEGRRLHARHMKDLLTERAGERRAIQSTYSGNPQALTWVGRRWSRWVSLDNVSENVLVPRHAGIYRLRRRRQSGLLYLGESDDLRRRLVRLVRGTRLAARGQRRQIGHWAAPCVERHMRGGGVVEVSWLLESVADKTERRGLECEYIAAHRFALGRNPTCQFVALPAEEE